MRPNVRRTLPAISAAIDEPEPGKAERDAEPVRQAQLFTEHQQSDADQQHRGRGLRDQCAQAHLESAAIEQDEPQVQSDDREREGDGGPVEVTHLFAPREITGRQHQYGGEQQCDGAVRRHQRQQRVGARGCQLEDDVVSDRGRDGERKPDQLHGVGRDPGRSDCRLRTMTALPPLSTRTCSRPARRRIARNHPADRGQATVGSVLRAGSRAHDTVTQRAGVC
jgi:hypothetical protein